MRNDRSLSRTLFIRAVTVVVATAMAGCVSSAGSTEGADEAATLPGQTRNIVRVGSYAPVEIFNEPGVGVRIVATSARNAWGVLGGVYEQLGIPIGEADPAAMRLGNPGFRARRVDGERLNAFVDCGSDFSGPLANQYEVTLSVATKLTAKGDESTEVLTIMDAYGRPRAVSGNSVHCQSRGVLEMRIAQLVAEALEIR